VALWAPGSGQNVVEWLLRSHTPTTTERAGGQTPRPESLLGWDGGGIEDGISGSSLTARDGWMGAGDGPQVGLGGSPQTVTTYKPIDMPPPVRIVIDVIGVDAKVVPVGILPSGAMEVPTFGLAGWYKLGAAPGELGPAVVVAHVDSRSGPDVFYRLKELAPGDEVRTVGEDGLVTVFAVQNVEQQRKADLPVHRIWDETPEPTIRLITCGGQFDYSTRHYKDNIIVYGTFLRTGT